MKIDLNKMSEDEFRDFLRYTKEGKQLKEIAMESYRKKQNYKTEKQ